ncbi:hypothetical protein F4804DRAFT_335871 [Jackrogersella minutella]|nr:hypothetical protein F4804DRAFT_335871 [Jackrogersella minutella]
MKVLSGASLVSILAAGLASAQGGHAPFSVTKFSAGATPHSSIGYVELSWSYPGSSGEIKCSAKPGTAQSFPSVAKIPCSDPSTFFSLTKRQEGGATLELWHEMTHGIHTIQEKDIVWTNQQSPTGTVQVYSGPQSFEVVTIAY